MEDSLRGPLRREGTVNEFAHGHRMRRCPYRGQGKAHIQHVLASIAINIERVIEEMERTKRHLSAIDKKIHAYRLHAEEEGEARHGNDDEDHGTR